MSEYDFVKFDFNGNQLNNLDRKGSMELGFHTFLLNFDDINYVSHTHPVHTLKVLCSISSSTFANKRLFPDQVVFNGGKSCLVPYAKPGEDLTNAIKKSVLDFINNEGYFPKLILLKNHGIITYGKNVDECIIAADICEKSAIIFNQDLTHVTFLSNHDVSNLINDEKEKYRQKQLK
jgi:L-fuculose-phosphate aldolase